MFIDLLRPCAKKGGGARRKEATRGGKKRVARGEESSRGKLPRRGEYGHDKESKILGISIVKPLCLCKNAKFGKIHKSNVKLLENNF